VANASEKMQTETDEIHVEIQAFNTKIVEGKAVEKKAS